MASIPNAYSTIESFIEMDRLGVYCVSCFDVLFCFFFQIFIIKFIEFLKINYIDNFEPFNTGMVSGTFRK